MIQEAAQAVAKQATEPTYLVIIAGLTSALTLLTKELLNILMFRLKGDRRRVPVEGHLSRDVKELTDKVGELSNQVAALKAAVDLLVSGKIKLS